MKRLSLLGLLAISMGLLTGCPIFDENGPGIVGCRGDDCGDPGGGEPNTTSTPNPNACKGPADCTGINETCASDGECHTGDCTLLGCVSGFVCSIGDDMKARCIEGTGTGGAGGTSTGGAGGTGGAPGTGGTGGAPGTGGAGTGGVPGSAGGAGGASSGGAGGAPGTGGASTGGAPGTGGTGGN